jgi:pimeloyl-ACP methyl ester carboxylesterase
LVLEEPPMLEWLRGSTEGQAMMESFQATAWEPARQEFHRGNIADGVKTFVDGVNGAGTYDRMSPTGRRMLMDNARAMQAEVDATEYSTVLSCDDLRRISVPVLLLNGEFSPKLFHTITDILARCLPNAAGAVIARASHAMHLENPQAYTESVLSFLRTTTMPQLRT